LFSQDLKSKEITALSDLLASLKVLCLEFWPDHVEDCDRLRLNMICRMLKTPHFSSKMNALKEVSRLIDESKARDRSNRRNIGIDQVVEWMAENKVLTVALEGNIDQVRSSNKLVITS
jgi:ubiquitin carboxyl-terminal hydrolase 9/24